MPSLDEMMEALNDSLPRVEMTPEHAERAKLYKRGVELLINMSNGLLDGVLQNPTLKDFSDQLTKTLDPLPPTDLAAMLQAIDYLTEEFKLVKPLLQNRLVIKSLDAR